MVIHTLLGSQDASGEHRDACRSASDASSAHWVRGAISLRGGSSLLGPPPTDPEELFPVNFRSLPFPACLLTLQTNREPNAHIANLEEPTAADPNNPKQQWR